MDNKKISVVMAIQNMDEVSIKKAKKMFNFYKNEKIITSGIFEDNLWHITDEYANHVFDFNISKDDYKAFEKEYGVTHNDIIDYLKTYIMFQMGSLSLVSLQNIILNIKRALTNDLDDANMFLDKISCPYINRISEFFSLLPADAEKASILLDKLDVIEDMSMNSAQGGQRSLSYFDSYFRLDDILKKFWNEATTEEKLFYFPIWMWWNVSSILPLRPREFVLTPRECITKTEDKYYLFVRRDNLKGSGKTVSYKINNDYQIYKYQIPEKLANEIIWYQEQTKNFNDTQLNTLFVTDTHYSKWERCTPYISRYFTYVNLRTCLRYFYEEVVINKYGYEVIYEREKMNLSNDKEIEFIQLGDTRHLALINLMIEGSTPMVAMMLAGHDNAEMSSHYYSNISTLIECRTYRQYKKLIQGKQNYSLSPLTQRLNVGDFTLLENKGRCYSQNLKNNDYSDCYKVMGPTGEIGFCPNCTYYRAEGETFRDSKDIYRNRLKNECDILQDIIKKVRSGNGDTEEIVQVLLRIKSESFSYQQYLLETKELNDGEEQIN